jgi:hypothetical protein
MKKENSKNVYNIGSTRTNISKMSIILVQHELIFQKMSLILIEAELIFQRCH